jgi:hypothetical protein
MYNEFITMKTRLLLAFLFASTLTLSAQSENKDKCGETREKAAADFKEGVRKIYVFGLVSNDKFRAVLKNKYQIDAVYMGCLVTTDLKCYSDSMEEMIAQERGFGFWEKVRLETETKKTIVSPF